MALACLRQQLVGTPLAKLQIGPTDGTSEVIDEGGQKFRGRSTFVSWRLLGMRVNRPTFADDSRPET